MHADGKLSFHDGVSYEVSGCCGLNLPERRPLFPPMGLIAQTVFSNALRSRFQLEITAALA